MKKTIFLACLFLYNLVALAQLSSTPGKIYTNLPGIDYLFVYNGITPLTEITYTGNGTNINWYKFTDTKNSISNVAYISPENATGYTLIVDGVLTHIWVIDYKNYLPVLNSIIPMSNPAGDCINLNLLLNATVPPLNYLTADNNSHILPRNFTVKYQTLSWVDGPGWKTIDTTQTVVLPATQTTVPVPYTNTAFTLNGDQYAIDLGLTPVSISSSQFVTQAVISHPTTVVSIRDAKNEADRPSSASPISFSAPIDVQFLSNANVPVPVSYRWEIFKNPSTSPIISRSEKDTRYTFTEFGTYNVKLTVSNNTCSRSDSIIVTVSESAIYVPNVFTPNGDGFNDEFRVAYKSLISFQCWVYNRWGRQVYHWTDPTKGWDGNINGKKAVPGPYFYVIKATGSDKKVYKLRGDINLLRGAKN